MNTRLSQDAADTLQGYEDRQAFRDAERARWARSQPPKIVGTLPGLSEADKEYIAREVAAGTIPF